MPKFNLDKTQSKQYKGEVLPSFSLTRL